MAETGRGGLRLAPEAIGWHSQLTAGFTNQRTCRRPIRDGQGLLLRRNR